MPEMTKSTETGSTEKVSLLYIFWVFLKLGATAFGGYMSLVAIVQKQLVEIDKKLKEEDLLDGISLTSVLPGPVAVNVIAYVGYKLRGVVGAMASFVAIIIPSFLLVLFLSWFYVSYGSVPAVKNFFLGITPAVTAHTDCCHWNGPEKYEIQDPLGYQFGFDAAIDLDRRDSDYFCRNDRWRIDWLLLFFQAGGKRNR